MLVELQDFYDSCITSNLSEDFDIEPFRVLFRELGKISNKRYNNCTKNVKGYRCSKLSHAQCHAMDVSAPFLHGEFTDAMANVAGLMTFHIKCTCLVYIERQPALIIPPYFTLSLVCMYLLRYFFGGDNAESDMKIAALYMLPLM